jgi:hypothetical protein
MGFAWVVDHPSCLFVRLAGRSGFFILGFQFEVLWIYLKYIGSDFDRLAWHSLIQVDFPRDSAPLLGFPRRYYNVPSLEFSPCSGFGFWIVLAFWDAFYSFRTFSANDRSL